MATITATFENQTVGAAISGSYDGLSAVSGSFICSSAYPMHGAKHVLLSNPGTALSTMRWLPTASRYIGGVFYVRISALPTADLNILRISDSSDTTSMQLIIRPSGALRAYSRGSISRWTSTTTLSTGTWYRIGVYMDAGTSATDGALRAAYFTGDATTATEDSGLISGINIADAVGVLNYFRLSKDTTNSYSGDLAFDTAIIKTDTDAVQTFAPYGNAAPTASAGSAQSNIEPGTTVTLTGSGTDSDGSIAAYAWTQTGGSPSVTLAGASSASCSFTAPFTMSGTTLTFQLMVTDNQGGTGTDTVTVGVLRATEFVRISGAWQPRQLTRRGSGSWQ